jgi:GT2 family glycosyltransferase
LEVIERYAERIKVMLKGLRVETDFIQGFCFALDREQFKELGGFDTLFLHGYYEDNDLMNRLSQKGKLIINPEVFVYHGSVKGASVSFRQIHLKSINALIRNSAIYAKKWGVSALIQRQIDLITHAIGFNTVSEVINEKETSI